MGGVVMLAVTSSGSFAQNPPAGPTPAQPWIQGAPFPDASEEVLGATAGGKLYVFCGLAPGWKPKALVFEYDPASNQWTKKRPMRLPSHHVAFASLNNKIYGFGGFTLPETGPPGWTPINNVWEYDPATDEWKELAPMPTRRGAASAAVTNGKIYVTGGANILPGVNENGIHPARPHNVVATVEEYDPAANTWRTVRPLLLARNHHAAASVADKVYVIGGRVGSGFISGTATMLIWSRCMIPQTICGRRGRACRLRAAPSERVSTRIASWSPAGKYRISDCSLPLKRWKLLTPRSIAGKCCLPCRVSAMALRWGLSATASTR